MEMENKEFAEKNAGKYFRYKGMKVRVIGYCAYDSSSIIVSLPRNVRWLWWGAEELDDDDVLVIRSKARRYLYVNQCELSLLCETKRFEIMNDVMFAKAHAGEYFHLGKYKVRVIGYDADGAGDSVIIDHPRGWAIEFADSTDVINWELCETGKCMYCKWEDLK